MQQTALDPQSCYQALKSRDARYDGRFFVGVRTTGIFCRSVCPAPLPKPKNCTYWPSAAAAQAAGFRPCLRCRPEAAPGTPAWNGTASTVSRALRLIEEGALDGEGSVADLAERLGIGQRHLSRLFHAHLGAAPRTVAQMRRTLFAKQLIDETDLSMIDVAASAGFSSQRRFNACVRRVYGRSPTALRAARRRPRPIDSAEGIELSLAYRPPFDWGALVGFLGARALPGVECVCPQKQFGRSFGGRSGPGTLLVSHDPDRSRLRVRVLFGSATGLIELTHRLRLLFDLDADSAEIDGHLAGHPLLAPAVVAAPGGRVPGAFSGFETAVRAILGQQISVKGATTLAARIAERFGSAVPARRRLHPDLVRTFPSPRALRSAPLEEVGVLGSRAETIRHLAKTVIAQPGLLRPGSGPESDAAEMMALPGIGPWTAAYISMRVLREPDALPEGDLGLRKALVLDRPGAAPATGAGVRAALESVRPYRAYAAMRLWSML